MKGKTKSYKTNFKYVTHIGTLNYLKIRVLNNNKFGALTYSEGG